MTPTGLAGGGGWTADAGGLKVCWRKGGRSEWYGIWYMVYGVERVGLSLTVMDRLSFVDRAKAKRLAGCFDSIRSSIK